jgi:hypothetical protein
LIRNSLTEWARHKGFEPAPHDAYSDTVRQKRWDWYVPDFSARLKPGAKRIIMNTRWHEEDVAGRVLEQIERKEIRPESSGGDIQADALSHTLGVMPPTTTLIDPRWKTGLPRLVGRWRGFSKT